MNIEENKLDAEEVAEEEASELENSSEEVENEGDAEGDESFDVDDALEFDENGDIIIPSEEDDKEEQGESEEEDDADADKDDSTVESGEAAEPAEEKKDGENGEHYREDYEALRAQVRDTLRLLGVEESDELAGLVKLAAEASETTPEDYLKKREQERIAEEARRTVQRTAFEKKMQEDLAAVHAAYPETRRYTSVMEFPNFKRFAELRDNGNTPTEAYDAAHPRAVRESAASAVRQKSLNDTKNHLKSTVPKGSKDNSVTMTKKELAQCRSMFPELSDKEILALYRKTK